MPPFIPRKRSSSSSPPARTTPVKRARLADALDEVESNRAGLSKAETFSLGSDDSDSSLSEVDSDEFEDVSADLKHQTATRHAVDDEDEDIEWEDAAPEERPTHTPMAGGDIQLTFSKDDDTPNYSTSATPAGRKGPSKREKLVRIQTHQLHVQFLLWHNALRNRWTCDKIVQEMLVRQLPAPIRREVERWRTASGLVVVEPEDKKPVKGKKRAKQKAVVERNERDWGRPSLRLEPGKADMSHGDPLISLMKVLSAYWQKRFAITAPGLRKRGYDSKQGLKKHIAAFRSEEHDQARFGERIRDLKEFRRAAEISEGSRDLGAQLFTALLRGLGLEARLVASLQPSGYGWTKVEQAVPRKESGNTVEDYSSEEEDDQRHLETITEDKSKKTVKSKAKQGQSRRSKRSGLSKDIPIDLDSDVKEEDNDSDDDQSIMDITPSLPKARPAKYDRDLVFPTYWAEAISPITQKVLSVSPLITASAVATTAEILALFEPRGAKADKNRQVMSYVVAYSSDGSAKDVTVRYLKNKIWPGKTKGFRLPIERLPVYNKHGKVKRYEDYDWFKQTMSGYTRPDSKRSAVDDLEDSTDLVPQLPPKKEIDTKEDTLQSLKASAEFVLERHLRREEALRPTAKHVRMFKFGKGDNAIEEEVYLRSDVERCLTAESWHKEGRRPKEGETPMKLVPVRAVTLVRKREAEEHQRRTGEKQMQGLYSWDQTEYIIPPPIRDGIIPKNAYGNMDCFVPSMVPRGAVHLPLRGTVRICKKLEIDFAEAVVGFEFGNKRAVPVVKGVVIAEENVKTVKQEWKKWNEEQRKKEETKMERLVLDLWRKFIMGMRIRERVQGMYGEDLPDVGQNELRSGISKDDPIDVDDEEAGLEPVHAVAEMEIEHEDDDMGGGFLMADENDQPKQYDDLVMEDHKHEVEDSAQATNVNEYPTPDTDSDEISPLRQGVRRQRKSLLEDAEADTDLSSENELCQDKDKALAESDVNGSDTASVESNPLVPSVRKPQQQIRQAPTSASRKAITKKISIEIAKSTSSKALKSKGRSNTSNLMQKQPPTLSRKAVATKWKSILESDPEDDDEHASTSDIDDNLYNKDSDSDEDDYSPPSKHTSNRTSTPRSKSNSMPKSKLKANAEIKSKPSTQPQSSIKQQRRPQKKAPSSPVLATETPSRRQPRRLVREQSSLVTSPYFERTTVDGTGADGEREDEDDL